MRASDDTRTTLRVRHHNAFPTIRQHGIHRDKVVCSLASPISNEAQRHAEPDPAARENGHADLNIRPKSQRVQVCTVPPMDPDLRDPCSPVVEVRRHICQPVRVRHPKFGVLLACSRRFAELRRGNTTVRANIRLS